MQLYTDVAAQYRDFAAYAQGESPCFEDWARRVADDEEVLAWIAALPPVKQQPNLVFAAARRHGVPAPGAYGGLRTALLDDDGAIRATILTRSTQTNEVGRLATLTPLLARVSREEGGPLALVEAGASAGLCLHPDRFGYDWHTTAGTVRARPDDEPHPTVLSCDVEGDAPLPADLPRVAWRSGLDLNPLDVHDEDATEWLETLVWPEQDERRARLRAAVSVARSAPATVVRGDLRTDLPSLVDEAARHGHPVVFHSAVAAYLEAADRERFQDTMLALVGAGSCRWVSNEAPGVLPRVAATAPEPPAGTRPFLLGLDGEAVAWTHGHGRWLRWL